MHCFQRLLRLHGNEGLFYIRTGVTSCDALPFSCFFLSLSTWLTIVTVWYVSDP